jgi:hypothetical protein
MSDRGLQQSPTAEQCRSYATRFKALAREPHLSSRRVSVLVNISRSWTALAHQLECLAAIVNEEEK